MTERATLPAEDKQLYDLMDETNQTVAELAGRLVSQLWPLPKMGDHPEYVSREISYRGLFPTQDLEQHYFFQVPHDISAGLVPTPTIDYLDHDYFVHQAYTIRVARYRLNLSKTRRVGMSRQLDLQAGVVLNNPADPESQKYIVATTGGQVTNGKLNTEVWADCLEASRGNETHAQTRLDLAAHFETGAIEAELVGRALQALHGIVSERSPLISLADTWHSLAFDMQRANQGSRAYVGRHALRTNA